MTFFRWSMILIANLGLLAACAGSPGPCSVKQQGTLSDAPAAGTSESFQVRCFADDDDTQCALQVGRYMLDTTVMFVPTCMMDPEGSEELSHWPEKVFRGDAPAQLVCGSGQPLPNLVRCWRKEGADHAFCHIAGDGFVSVTPMAHLGPEPVCTRELRDETDLDLAMLRARLDELKQEEPMDEESLARIQRLRPDATQESLNEERQASIEGLTRAIRELELERSARLQQPKCETDSQFVTCDGQARHFLGGEHFYLGDIFQVYPANEYVSRLAEDGLRELTTWPAPFSCAAGEPLPSGTIQLTSQ